MRIIIADDHALVREGLKALIQGHYCGDVIIDECDGFESLSKMSDQYAYDLALVDYNMGERSGLEELRNFCARYPDCSVIVVSMYKESLLAEDLYQVGVRGFVSKCTSAHEILQAIASVDAGEVYFSGAIIKKLMTLRKDQKTSFELLSPKELEVAKLIATGKSMKAIAHELDIKSNTLSTYKKRIFEKISVNNFADFIEYFKLHS